MLCAVSIRRLRTVIVLLFLLLIIVVYLSYESHEENNEPPLKDPFIKSPKPIFRATTEEYEYEEIPIIPSWAEFIPTDVRYEKDIFFLETRG